MVVIVVAALIALIAWSTLRGPRYRVSVCMSYAGHASCRTVNAKTEAAAIRSATENACADIASGVTDTVRCQQTEPQSVKWLSRPE